MISDIKSMISGQSSSADTPSARLNTVGTLAKLSNEMKLIENLTLIKFQGSETTSFQGKPVQLLHASSQHQPFTLINSGPTIDISDLNNVKMTRNGQHQASLDLPTNSNTQLSNQTGSNQTRATNLNIASQVIQLTVVSSIPSPLSTNTATPQTSQLPLNTQQTVQSATSPSSSTAASANTTNSNPVGGPQTQPTSAPSQAQANVANSRSFNNSQTSTTPSATSTTQNTAPSSAKQNLNTSPSNGTNSASEIRSQGQTELTYAALNKRPLSNLSLTNSNSVPSSTSKQTSHSAANPISGSQITNTRGSAQPTQTQAASLSQPAQGQHILQVTDGRSEFELISQQALKKGDILRVFVDSNNQLQSLPTKQTNEALPLQAQALRQSLPKQLSGMEMGNLINQLQNLSQSEGADLPPRTQQALQQLLQHLPNLSQVTSSPEAMKQAMQSSGTFAESLLLNDQKSQIPADFKLNLERLRDSQDPMVMPRISNALPTEQIANAIERITTNQLRHLSEPGQFNSQMYPLHIEVPIKDQQQHRMVQIEIDQDKNQAQGEKHERRWLVKLQFDFEETGRFDARTSIQGNKVGILFAAESLDTVQKLQRNMPILKDKLSQKDIEIERLDAFQAKLAQAEKSSPTQQSLIDVRT